MGRIIAGLKMTTERASCVVVTWFSAFQVGFLDFSYRIRALSSQFKVTVVSRGTITQEELLVPGAEYVVLQTGDTSKRSLLTYIVRVTGLLRRLRPHVVIYLGSQTAAAALLTPGQRSAVYWNEHPSHYLPRWPWTEHPLKALGNLILREATYLGAARAQLAMPIGEAHLEDLLEHGASSDRLRLLYMGVDKMFVRAAEKCIRTGHDGEEPLRLVYTGSVSKERGRDVMLEGLSLANRDEVRARLTIIGASPEQMSYCRNRAAELGIERHVEVVSRVSGNAIPSLIATADLGVCIWEDRTHWRFNPPTKLFEYLVAGLPVLASDIRTHSQYVTDWSNGLIFRYSAASFAEKIVELWARRAELTSLRRNAANSGAEYLWERIEPKFLGAVSSIAGCGARDD